MADRYVNYDKLLEKRHRLGLDEMSAISKVNAFNLFIDELPVADVVEVDEVSEKIIRKKAEVVEYWKNNVRYYRAMQGYSDIEHDTDNFLRGYNEAVEDMLAILDERNEDDD